MLQFVAPKIITENIARAKSLIRRDQPLRAIDCLLTALEEFHPEQIIGKARYEIEVTLSECLTELNRHPVVHNFLVYVTKSEKAAVCYSPGQEKKIALTLGILRKGLHRLEETKKNDTLRQQQERKTELLEKGKQALARGDVTRGKASLRKLAEEFGHEAGIFYTVGEILAQAALPCEAAEFLEQAIEAFPKDSRAYSKLAACYTSIGEHAHNEQLYLKALRQFGPHPITLLNLARVYIAWNKKDKAFEVLQKAARLAPENKDILTLLDALS